MPRTVSFLATALLFVCLSVCGGGSGGGGNGGGNGGGSGGGGGKNPDPTGSLKVLFEFNIKAVDRECKSNRTCFCTSGQCGQAFLEVLVEGRVSRKDTPFMPFGPKELSSGILKDESQLFNSLPQGGYIVTIKRRLASGDLVLSRTNPRTWFSLGFKSSFNIPVTVVKDSTSTILVKATAVKNESNGSVPATWELLFVWIDESGVEHILAYGPNGIGREISTNK